MDELITHMKKQHKYLSMDCTFHEDKQIGPSSHRGIALLTLGTCVLQHLPKAEFHTHTSP